MTTRSLYYCRATHCRRITRRVLLGLLYVATDVEENLFRRKLIIFITGNDEGLTARHLSASRCRETTVMMMLLCHFILSNHRGRSASPAGCSGFSRHHNHSVRGRASDEIFEIFFAFDRTSVALRRCQLPTCTC